MTYILLIIGFALLIKGADLFVNGSSNIAKLLRVPTILIGLTIVAFGTSSPEATVSIIAALKGNADVALGNVVGSNILNSTLIVGVTAFLYPLRVESETIRKEIPFALLASVALLILMSDIALQGSSSNLLTRSDGFILLLFLSIFMYYLIEIGLKSRKEKADEPVPEDIRWGKNILITILGLAAIIFGGDLVVDNGTTKKWQPESTGFGGEMGSWWRKKRPERLSRPQQSPSGLNRPNGRQDGCGQMWCVRIYRVCSGHPGRRSIKRCRRFGILVGCKKMEYNIITSR
ncbi:Sodium/calcium exchanger protein [Anoxybacillus pushchinoensis]|uniref:Sodium/calcium exchanger protein n=1 Tax=Anoxybacillus pushchinoensis TaxID=150248 RepID=A0A1I0TNC7_9BACL|nr:Sodium/calcium exchanger protein [Anoxybacillus pushchinoensis]